MKIYGERVFFETVKTGVCAQNIALFSNFDPCPEISTIFPEISTKISENLNLAENRKTDLPLGNGVLGGFTHVLGHKNVKYR